MARIKHGKVNDQYVGTAPYNFISLNEQVISISSEELPDRSLWYDDRKSGVINCTLCTESPVFVAGSQEGSTEFFHHGDPERPVIPGSSLRGMLRTIVEIISFSKLQPITDKKLFFRDIRDQQYQPRFVGRIGYSTASTGTLPSGTPIYGVNVKAGILHHNTRDGYSLEQCEMARVWRKDLQKDLSLPDYGPKALFVRHGNRVFPNPMYQGLSITVDVDPVADHPFPAQPRRHPNLYLRFRKVTGVSSSPSTRKSVDGRLVITGDMQNKKMEFVFLPTGTFHPDPGGHLYDIVERFESHDQITEWQEKAFPKDQPARNSRRMDGALYDGEPVFYLEDDATGELEFIGRAQLFRLPFGYPPSELRYPDHKDAAGLDFAEVLFGFVDKPIAGQSDKKWTAASRVSVTDAKLTSKLEESVWLDPEHPAFHTHILSSPKPSAYAHYLVQPDPNSSQRFTLSNHRQADAVIRGHKLYWHQTKTDGDNSVPLGVQELRTQPNPNNPEQHPQIKPIRSGLEFAFQVHFENLTKAELGALLWAIELPGSEHSMYRHKLGMGKPLGMGSIKLSAQSLEILSPMDRLGALLTSFDSNAEDSDSDETTYCWVTGFQREDTDSYHDAFQSWVEDKLSLGDGEFVRHERIRQLQDMLRWPGLKTEDAAYMGFEEHKQKLVLPDAETVYSNNRMTLQPTSACEDDALADEDAAVADAAVDTDPQPGNEIRGMVYEIDDSGVFLEPVDLPEAYEDYLLFIAAVDLAGRQYTVDLPARVVVVSIDDNREVINCRPKPRG